MADLNSSGKVPDCNELFINLVSNGVSWLIISLIRITNVYVHS